METQNAETEEQEFTQVEVSRHLSPEHNKTVGGNQAAWLNANRGRMVGPGRTQEIFAGDSIGLQVFGKYLDKKKPKVNAGSFVSQGAKDRLITNLNELALNTQRAGGGNPIALLNLASIVSGDLQKKPAPESYLIYALYDQDSNRYEVGKKVLTRNAANQHEVLEENLYIQKDGYLETFVVNETSEDVWFDNMMVMSMSSPIAQETHFDPWGLELTGIGFQYGGIKVNKFLYNGIELIEDQDLNIYSALYRNYDPAIGRWWQIDPKTSERESPYVGMGNNPILYSDYLGDTIVIGNLSWLDKVLNKIGYETDEMKYVNKVVSDIDQLKKDDKDVAEMIIKLEESEFTHRIEQPKNDGKGNRVTFDKDKADRGERQGTIIGYDPDSRRTVNNEKRSPRVGLAHELRHAHDSDIKVISTVPSINGILLREINAINTENRIRKITGDEKKNTYGNRKIPSSTLD